MPTLKWSLATKAGRCGVGLVLRRQIESMEWYKKYIFHGVMAVNDTLAAVMKFYIAACKKRLSI